MGEMGLVSSVVVSGFVLFVSASAVAASSSTTEVVPLPASAFGTWSYTDAVRVGLVRVDGAAIFLDCEE